MLKSVYDSDDDGIIDTSALGSGTANNTTYLRGDNSWVTISGGGLLNEANTWTEEQHFGAISTAYEEVSAGTTLDATHQLVAVNAIGGEIMITLPAAAGCTGRKYNIMKADSSANTVTIDGDGSETINGSLTNVLSAQYSAVTLVSNGSGWYVW